MVQGRKRVPTQLRELHGNPTHRPLPTHEPKPTGDLSEAPEWMTPSQQAGWRYALRHSPTGLLKLLDRGVLAVWVVAEDLHREASQALAGTGLLVLEPLTRKAVQSPYLGIVNRQAVMMLKAASDLGFNPVSRPRIMINPAPGVGFNDGKAPTEADTIEGFLASDPGPLSIN